MKKIFVFPQLEIFEWESADVIASSGAFDGITSASDSSSGDNSSDSGTELPLV